MLPRSQYLQLAITIASKISTATGTRILTFKDPESPSDNFATTIESVPLGLEALAVGIDRETSINAVDVSAVDISFDGISVI